MTLGLTGASASGKGTVAEILVRGGFEYFSLSDEIRYELVGRGIEPTREALIEEGRRLRNEFGLDILARRVVARFTPGINHVVDSIRNPMEVQFLRSQPDFFLILVEAPIEKRFERARLRARPGDNLDFPSFEAAERRELASGDPAAQQLLATFKMADFVIVNDSDLETLRTNVVRIFREAASKIVRPDWDEYFMRIADVVASRSSCAKRRVAAVVVRDRRVISTGYNGTPRGTRNCNAGGCERCLSLAEPGTGLNDCVCSHAEENAIVQAAYHGVSLKGATLYSTFMPCVMCSKMIINSGIVEVVYRAQYPLPESAARLFEEANIAIRRL